MIQNQPYSSGQRWKTSTVSLIGSGYDLVLHPDETTSGYPYRRKTLHMNLTLESRDGLLLATVTGRVSCAEALECWKNVCDAAAELGCSKILFDWLGVEGEISDLEKYKVSMIIVKYCVHASKSPTVVVVGKPPTITGFGALVALNRGLMVVTFGERQAGLDWLSAFGSKATAT